VDYLYTSKIFDTEANVAWTSPTSKANLRIGATRDGYLVELYGTNIFDNRTPTNLARNTDSYTGTNAISVSLPDRATFGIRVSAKL
jgi:iron complex outermembrane receptor protein